MYEIFKMKNELLNKDIENIEELIKGAKDFEQYEGNKCYKSMENILHINKNLQNKVKELEETNRIFALEGSKISLELYIKKN